MALIAYLLWLLAFLTSVAAAGWFQNEPLASRLMLVALSGAGWTGLLAWYLGSYTRQNKASASFDEIVAQTPNPEPSSPPIKPLADMESAPWDEFFSTIQRNRPFRETAEKLTTLLPEFFPGVSGALYLHNSSQQTLQMILAFGERVIGPNCFAPGECESFLHADIQVREEGIPGGHPFCTHMRHADTGISLCAPIEGMSEHMGVLCLQQPEGTLEESDLLPLKHRVRLICSSLGLALANLDLQAKFQLHSIRDPLTGMFNRRYLEESLLREVSAAERHRTSIGMILLHPDTIQTYRSASNAHAADQLLWELGQRLPRYIRNEDIPCRYDGDVLCVLLPGADQTIVQERAERIRREVEGLEIRFGEILLHTTLSLGVATLPKCGNSARALTLACEKALVQAQGKGGNCGVIA